LGSKADKTDLFSKRGEGGDWSKAIRINSRVGGFERSRGHVAVAVVG